MATERYLLGEMTGPELDDFEEHMFVCTECAAAVTSGAAFTENARAVFNERPDLFAAESKKRSTAGERPAFFWKWFSFPQLATSFAALALACVAGYQQFVTIPALLAPRAVSEYALAATARGTETPSIPPGVAAFNVLLDEVSSKCPKGCTAVLKQGGKRGSKQIGPPINLKIAEDHTAAIFLNRSAVPAGDYTVFVYKQGPEHEEAAEYPFRVE